MEVDETVDHSQTVSVRAPGGGGARLNRAVTYLVLALLLLLSLNAFAPLSGSLLAGNIDATWNLVLLWTHQHAIDFGHDFVFTFGPYGFTYHGYSPSTARWSLFAWSLNAVAFFAGTLQIARRLSPKLWVRAAWMLAALILAGVSVDCSQDMRLYSSAWLLLILHFFVQPRRFGIAEFLLTAALALGGLVKFTVLSMAVPVLVVISVDEIFNRRVPRVLLAYIILVLALWLAAGQKLSSLGAWLANSMEVVAGYPAAQESTAVGRSPISIFAFLLSGLFMLGITIAAARRAFAASRIRVGLWSAGFAGVFFILFKTGYVRQDVHEMLATNSLALLALLSAGAIWCWLNRSILRWGCVAAVAVCVIVGSESCWTWKGTTPVQDFLASVKQVLFWPQTAWQWAAGNQRLQEMFRAQLNAMELPNLPPIHGSVDAYPWDDRPILGAGLDYDPRPVIHSYVSYTPKLARLNADFLQSNRSPENILFDVRYYEDHFAPQDDAPSWPMLLSRYDLAWASPKLLLLHKSEHPREIVRNPIKSLQANVDQPIDVPDAPGPVWVRIHLQKTALGHAASALYRPPRVGLDVTMSDGGHILFRLVPPTADDGFLLSPVILRPDVFQWLYSPQWRQKLSAFVIEAITITGYEGSDLNQYYASPFEVEFSYFQFSHQDISQVPGVDPNATPQLSQ